MALMHGIFANAESRRVARDAKKFARVAVFQEGRRRQRNLARSEASSSLVERANENVFGALMESSPKETFCLSSAYLKALTPMTRCGSLLD